MDRLIANENKIAAMVVSIGGTPAPIIRSIAQYAPEFVSFFASQETFDQVTSIKTELLKNGIVIRSEITITDNVNDLLCCHEKAEEAVKRVTDKQYRNDEVIVDYTGGTKNMSVALALAAITHGFSFSYVGGEKRTKNGVGTVEDGHEKIYPSVNPWDVLAIEEKRKIALLFNRYQFKAAKDLIDTLQGKNTKYKSLFKKIGFLIEGYYKWDLFRHEEARDSFNRARIEDIIEADSTTFGAFAKDSAELKNRFLVRLVEANKKPSGVLALDLYANAERRFDEGKIDDAILRLYRLVEMAAQERLDKCHGIDTSNVPLDKIPDSIRDEFTKEYMSQRTRRIQLPQTAAFRLLHALQDDLGKRFEQHKKRFLDIQSSRNYSYLAHGFGSSSEKTYTTLRTFIFDIGLLDPSDAPTFPKIEVAR